MVRYARSYTTGSKKPQEATKWEDFSEATHTESESSNTTVIRKPFKKSKHLKSGSLFSGSPATVVPTSAKEGLAFQLSTIPVQAEVDKDKNEKTKLKKKKKNSKEEKNVKKLKVADMLKDFKKQNANLSKDEEKEIADFVHKDQRREDRRLKRQDKKKNETICFNCRKPGHSISDCPQASKDVDAGSGICFKCGSTEHMVHSCRVKLPPGEFPFAKCFICSAMGHLSNQCPDNPRGLYPKGGCCRHCGSVEHYVKDCPVNQEKQGIEDMKLAVLSKDTSADEEFSFLEKKVVIKRTGPKVVKF